LLVNCTETLFFFYKTTLTPLWASPDQTRTAQTALPNPNSHPHPASLPSLVLPKSSPRHLSLPTDGGLQAQADSRPPPPQLGANPLEAPLPRAAAIGRRPTASFARAGRSGLSELLGRIREMPAWRRPSSTAMQRRHPTLNPMRYSNDDEVRSATPPIPRPKPY